MKKATYDAIVSVIRSTLHGEQDFKVLENRFPRLPDDTQLVAYLLLLY